MTKTKRICPHCGNTDPAFIEDNGESASSPDLTLLCIARVDPYSHNQYDVATVGADGLTACGTQWEPNT